MVHYEIKTGNTLIYSSFRLNEDFAATNIKLTEEINKVPSMTFDLPPNNQTELEVMKDEVTMFRNGGMIFRGRVTQRKKKSNKFTAYTVEGDLGYLHDILVRPYSSQSMSEQDYFESFFGESGTSSGTYNSHATAARRFVKGTNQGDTGANTVYLPENNSYPDCFKELTEHLDIYNGGYIKTRHVENNGTWTHYIDFVKPPLTVGSQKILYAQNILDINDDDDGRDIVTHFIPLGKTVDKKRTTLETAYTPDYIEADSAVISDYGIIERTEDYSEVEDTSTLEEFATHDFDAMGLTAKTRAVKVKAIDISIVGDDTPLEVGRVYEVYSHPHGIEFVDGEEKQLQRAEIDPNNPDKCVYWFGDVPKDSMRRIQEDRARQEEIRQRVLEEASYTNAISAESDTDSGTTYSTQSGGSKTTGGKDLTTTSGYNTGSGSGAWSRVELFDGGDIELNISNLSVDVDSGVISGTIVLSLADLNSKVQLFKNINSVSVGKSVNNASVVAGAADSTGNVIGCSVSGVSDTSVDVTIYAIGDSADTNASAIAIGTDTN